MKKSLTEVSEFLSGRSGEKCNLKEFMGNNSFSVPDIAEQGKGTYLYQHTAFLEHKVMFGLYISNTFKRDTQVANGVKRAIKVVLGRAYKGARDTYRTYPKANDHTKEVSFKLGGNRIADLAALLSAPSGTVNCEIQNGIQVSFVNQGGRLSIITKNSPLNISVELDAESAFEFRMTITKYCKLLHPEVPVEFSFNQLAKSGFITGEARQIKEYSKALSNNELTTSNLEVARVVVLPISKEALDFVNDIESFKQALSALTIDPITPSTKASLWAIAHQTWNRGDRGRTMIQALQNHGGEVLCRQLVDAANENNFSTLDDLYKRINQD